MNNNFLQTQRVSYQANSNNKYYTYTYSHKICLCECDIATCSNVCQATFSMHCFSPDIDACGW